MRIDEEVRVYEGVRANSAVVMAFMEGTGLRRLIDERCRSDGICRTLSVGMAVKAMIGAMYRGSGRTPLYLMDKIFGLCPTDKLFGNSVKPSSLSDTSLGRCLDVLSKTDMEKLLWDCSEMLCERYGLDSHLLSMDATNYALYGMGIEDGGTVPAFGGNSKTNRNDLMQKNIHAVTNGNGVLRTSKPYGGNVADMTMNNDMIEFLVNRVDPDKVVISADCKLANNVTVDRLLGLGWGFVTKAPSNFNGLVKDSVVSSAITGVMDASPRHPGRYLYDTESEYGNGKLRFVAYRLPGSIDESQEYLRNGGFEIATKRISKFKSRKFFCEDDARKAFDEMMDGYCGAYRTDVIFSEDSRLMKKDPDGPHWRGRTGTVSIVEDKIAEAAERFSIRVLVTNLPFAVEDGEDLRKGATADKVVDVYLGQYHSEKNFRIMKSGMGVNHVYLHLHRRQDAMVTVVSLATMLSNVMDSVLPGKMTANKVIDDLDNGIVEYDRDGDAMRFSGPPGLRENIFGILGALGVENKFLLGF